LLKRVFPFLWYKHPDPPLTPLSQKRERGRGRKGKGEYIKCERSFQYIIYILQTPFLLYTPPLYPSSLSSERERGEGRGRRASIPAPLPPTPLTPPPIFLYTQIPLLPVINKWGEWEGGGGGRGLLRWGNGTEL